MKEHQHPYWKSPIPKTTASEMSDEHFREYSKMVKNYEKGRSHAKTGKESKLLKNNPSSYEAGYLDNME